MIALILRFFLLAAANVVVILSTDKGKENSTFIRVLRIIVVVLDCILVGILLFAVSVFEYRWYMRVSYILAAALALWFLLALLFHWLSWKRAAIWFACVLAVSGVIGGVEGYQSYLSSITLKEQFDYRTYTPFRKDSLAVTVDEPATLRFTADDRLPRLDGATALYPVYAAFYQAVYPYSTLAPNITCSTTTGAYRSIVNGNCDLIFVAGPSEEQEAYAAEHGVELVYTPIGREAFVFFVHPDNPLDGLRLEDIRGIYSGEITDWAQLGAADLGPILAYQRDEGSGSQTALERFVMRDTPLMPADKEKTIDGMGGIIEQVSSYQNHRNAIGFSFRFYCTELTKGFDVKLLKIDDVAPTVENIKNGTYPLASSFYAVTRSDADENTLAFLEWICGEQGQALVEKSGYTPIAAGS
ncbi:MAG: substrate-binding domain-containing protein [Oscillospiraceae bacterium]|nr:substrate-binding domain-containing protein [Oscillospiraceae bacterium]